MQMLGHEIWNLKQGQMCCFKLISIWETRAILWLVQHGRSSHHPLILIQTLYFPIILCVRTTS